MSIRLTANEKRRLEALWLARPGASGEEVAAQASRQFGRAISPAHARYYRPKTLPATAIGRPPALTADQRGAIAALWRDDPHAGKVAIAERASRRLGRTVSPSAAYALRPAGLPPMRRGRGGADADKRHLTESQRQVVAGLWGEHPRATAKALAAMASKTLGRYVSVSTALAYKPRGNAPPVSAPRAAPRDRDARRRPSLPYESPLGHLIAEGKAVARRLGIGRARP